MDAPLLPDDFKEFLRLLNARGVDYLVVGGYAVGLHGAAVLDIDDLRLPVISLEDLKTNKRAAGRNKDLADLDELP